MQSTLYLQHNRMYCGCMRPQRTNCQYRPVRCVGSSIHYTVAVYAVQGRVCLEVVMAMFLSVATIHSNVLYSYHASIIAQHFICRYCILEWDLILHLVQLEDGGQYVYIVQSFELYL